MNMSLSPHSSIEHLSSNNINELGYGIIFSVGILILITIALVSSYLCIRTNITPRELIAVTPSRPSTDIETGLDEATLMSYPKVLYSEAKLQLDQKGNTNNTVATCCSICLADYKDSDELRQLGDCGQVFHMKCVDPWVRLHPSCPLCRTSPLPTPLAEVVPDYYH